MVNVEISLKEVIGLAEINSLTKEKFKELLDKFSRSDFINYILDSVSLELPSEETPNNEDDVHL